MMNDTDLKSGNGTLEDTFCMKFDPPKKNE